MKKLLKIISIILVASFLTTGCMEANIKMGINADKSMDFSSSLVLDLDQFKELAESYGASDSNTMTDEEYFDCLKENDGDESKCNYQDPSTSSSTDFNPEDFMDNDTYKEMEDLGFTVTQNTTDSKYELTISKKYNNIDELTKTENFTLNLNDITTKDFDNKFFTIKKGLLEDTYELNMLIETTTTDISGSNSTDTETLNIDPSMFSDLIKYNYQLTLPNVSLSNNATSVSQDQKTLTWELKPEGNNEIKVSFAIPNENKDLIIYGAAGLGGLLVLIIIIIIISKSRKKKKNKQAKEEPVVEQQPTVNQNPTPTIDPQSNGPVPMATPQNGPISLETMAPQPLPINPQPLPEAGVNPLPVEPTTISNPVPEVPVNPIPEPPVIPNPVPEAPISPIPEPPVIPNPVPEAPVNPIPEPPVIPNPVPEVPVNPIPEPPVIQEPVPEVPVNPIPEPPVIQEPVPEAPINPIPEPPIIQPIPEVPVNPIPEPPVIPNPVPEVPVNPIPEPPVIPEPVPEVPVNPIPEPPVIQEPVPEVPVNPIPEPPVIPEPVPEVSVNPIPEPPVIPEPVPEVPINPIPEPPVIPEPVPESPVNPIPEQTPTEEVASPEVNKINSDLQNMAMDILNKK